ncbi:MAG: tyrosine-type recombinase/integrase [Lentisphaerae bacterium]|nr:tyrosine-type recombinase/integrase [Lentisphaerota bacterium]
MNMNRTELFYQFLEEEKIKGRREQGLIGLKFRVPKFFIFLDESDLCLTTVGTSGALDYQLWLIETGRKDGGSYSMRTVSSYLMAVTAFYEYLKVSGLVLGNPFKEIRKVRSEKKLPSTILKENQMSALLDELEDFTSEKGLKRVIRKYRLHIICELLYSTGLRVSEAAALKVNDIDLVRGTVSVKEGKGGFSRTTILNDYCRIILTIFINEIRPLILTSWHDENLLFGTGSWDRFGKVVNEGLKEYSEKIKIPSIRSHGFRHAVGYHLLKEGCPIRSIQEILGHRSLKNTEIYTKVDKEDLKGVLDRFHPRKKVVVR